MALCAVLYMEPGRVPLQPALFLIEGRYGYSSLPQDWLDALPHKKWLDKKVVALLQLLRLIDETGHVMKEDGAEGEGSAADGEKEEKGKKAD